MWLRMFSWSVPALCTLLLSAPGRANDKTSSDRALIVVRLPASATLMIGSSSTQQTGAERQFRSPSLEPGRKYSYELTASWDEGGKPRKEVRDVTVFAGKTVVVNFNDSVKPAKEPEAPAKPAVKSRTFLFTYAATVTGLAPDQKARVWL